MNTDASSYRSGYGEFVESGALQFVRVLPGPVERVWAWLADSGKRAQWLAAGELPAQPGMWFEMRFDHNGLTPDTGPVPERFRAYEAGVATRHRLLRCEPPHLLSISWGGGNEELSEVTFELSPQGEQVRLVLTHRRLVRGDTLRSVSSGWHTHLQVLADKLAGRVPPPFWTMVDTLEQDYAARLGQAAAGNSPP
ncbi:SRPBCC family protein [Bordetella sp. BOR01]|uniref:SRPBCC family protein n=1 Tax=Bordetella sp. BOR01 TaxID=2854779 RepID=UPI001C45B384|nr:SRPBCC family protein [Bordetella sp. BOR01]MBV7482680.1 SRPBCC family protein [Bordetella sp. BOR01]